MEVGHLLSDALPKLKYSTTHAGLASLTMKTVSLASLIPATCTPPSILPHRHLSTRSLYLKRLS